MIGIIGSINIDYVSYIKDFPKEGETINSNKFSVHFGGKGANQAVAAAKTSSVKTSMFGKIKYDTLSLSYKDYLQSVGVSTDYVLESKMETGNALILFSEAKKNNQIIINKLANDDYSKSDLALVEKFIDSNEMIIFQNEINYSFIEQCLILCKQKNKKVVFNPAPVSGFKNEWLKYIDFLVPNETELAELSGLKEDQVQESSELIMKLGCKNLIVTMGANGVYNSISKEVLPSHKVKVLDTTAAGDTFIGSFTGQLVSGASVQDAIKYANKAASITVQREGAAESIPTKEEI